MVGKPFGDRDILNICSFGGSCCSTMSIIAYYYYFKRESIKLNYGFASLKHVHSLLDRSEMVS